MAYGVQ